MHSWADRNKRFYERLSLLARIKSRIAEIVSSFSSNAFITVRLSRLVTAATCKFRRKFFVLDDVESIVRKATGDRAYVGWASSNMR